MATTYSNGVWKCWHLRVSGYQGVRYFSQSIFLSSGHNKWSKIKYDKAKEDMKKNKERSAVAQELRTASALYGPDLSSNHRLSAIVVSAKKAGLPKALIENSIARGQGKSISGQALEPLTVEAMIPPSIAFIIECQTDSKARTLTYVKLAIKDFGGSMATTNHLFSRKGRIVFEKPSSQGNDPLFEQLIDEHTIGADFLDEEKLVIFTEPNQTSGAAEAISKASGRRIESMDIFWDPKPETMMQTMIDTDSENVVNFFDRLNEVQGVQNIYANVDIDDIKISEQTVSE